MRLLFTGLMLAAVASGELLCPRAAQAQRTATDYVVTTAGDTLRGRLQLSGKSLQTLRLLRPGQEPATFTPDQITSYGVGHTLLKSSKRVGAAGSARLLVPLVRGYVSLYTGPNAEGTSSYYLQPIDSAHVVELTPATAQLTYARQLPGCSTLEIGTAKFQERYPYTRPGLLRLITDYNKCRQQPTELVRVPSGVSASYGFKVGLNRSAFQLNTDDYSRQVYASNHTDAVGFQVGALLLLNTRSPFSFQAEATYVKLSSTYGATPVYVTGIQVGIYVIRLRYSQVQVPLLLRYTVGHGKVAPYLLAGPAIGYNFANKSTVSGITIGSTTPVETPYANPIDSFSLGASGGAGLLVRSAGRLGLQVEGRYDYVVDNKDLNLYHQSLRLETSVLF